MPTGKGYKKSGDKGVKKVARKLTKVIKSGKKNGVDSKKTVKKGAKLDKAYAKTGVAPYSDKVWKSKNVQKALKKPVKKKK